MTMSISKRDACPKCGCPQVKKNGHIHTGKQNHRGKECGRQFVANAAKRVIDQEHRTLMPRLFCEKISLHGICRTIGVSIRWLRDFLVACFSAVPEHLHVQMVTFSREVVLGCLDVEADELWSFVQKKADPRWVWIAMDKQTHQILAFHVGNRSQDSAKQLWVNMPAVYRARAIFYTDQYAAVGGVIPTAQHRAITKSARKTNHIERFNNTLRQRVSRLVRSTLAFSKSVENHIGAIRYFIGHYNLSRAALLG